MSNSVAVVNTLSHDPLTDWLRTASEERIAALLRERPDLLVPLPVDLADLADRANLRVSVLRALERLDAFVLQILDALLLLEEDGVASYSRLVTLIGPTVPAQILRRALDQLGSLLLLWGDDQEFHVLSAVREVTSPYTAGLGRPIATLLANHSTAQLAPLVEALNIEQTRQPAASAAIARLFADQHLLAALLNRCGKQERAVLEQLSMGPPVGTVRDALRPVRARTADTPIRWLLAHGLLVAIDANTVELPREIGLALRDHSPLGTIKVEQPTIVTRAHKPSTVDTIGSAQASETLRLTTELLTEYGENPPDVLRTGGLSMRDLRRAARLLNVDEARVALYIEVAYAAGLMGSSGNAEAEWLPTEIFDKWLRLPPARRWTKLAQAWLRMPRIPSLAGSIDERDKPRAVLSPDLERPTMPAIRRRILGSLAAFPPGHTAEVADIAQLLLWQSPRRASFYDADTVDVILTEAESLGITGHRALTHYARQLLANHDPSTTLATLLPQPVKHILVQADLTIVAPGPLDADLANEIGLLADIESSGGATVYRVSEATMRRAFDAGRTADQLHELFAQRSKGSVPQTLTYLINDVARRHGDLRSGTATSYLRCDDEVLLGEVLADRGVGSLKFRRIAPTVLISSAPMNTVLEVLRSNGFTPMGESNDGAVIVNRPMGMRLPAPHSPIAIAPAQQPPTPDFADLKRLARTIKSGRSPIPRERSTDRNLSPSQRTTENLALLQEAARSRQPVLLGYVNTQGQVSQHIIEPISVGGGYLRGFDQKRNNVSTFALQRIHSVTVLDHDIDPGLT